ncbi:uncharacterized protein N7479_000494 [Penicillium vulpinum]|uniref:uncharacterized protein n=1 Tax=Penicillium vulpinum TaxID=29845 RepID=UPI00254811D0|nr:uncharacterized protein N7479_000494 [Penicillium vulpinum]KAJ5970576.1 hypothetical protein N7479_000494 [Penicillium vulpinum]
MCSSATVYRQKPSLDAKSPLYLQILGAARKYALYTKKETLGGPKLAEDPSASSWLDEALGVVRPSASRLKARKRV